MDCSSFEFSPRRTAVLAKLAFNSSVAMNLNILLFLSHSAEPQSCSLTPLLNASLFLFPSVQHVYGPLQALKKAFISSTPLFIFCLIDDCTLSEFAFLLVSVPMASICKMAGALSGTLYCWLFFYSPQPYFLVLYLYI